MIQLPRQTCANELTIERFVVVVPIAMESGLPADKKYKQAIPQSASLYLTIPSGTNLHTFLNQRLFSPKPSARCPKNGSTTPPERTNALAAPAALEKGGHLPPEAAACDCLI